MSHFAISALSAVAYGGYAYFRNLLPALGAVDAANRYTILVKTNHLEEFRIDRENFRFVPVPECSKSPGRRMLWEQAVLPGRLRQWKVDAIYTANNVGILRSPVPLVTAIRNLEPFFHREYRDNPNSRWRNGMLLWLTRRSLLAADRVVVVSDFTREVVAGWCAEAAGKLRVIRHGRPMIPPDEEGARALRERLGLKEYLLTNSKFVPYSNLDRLVRGYARAVERNPGLPPLVLAGGDASRLYKETVLGTIRELQLKDRVVPTGLIPYPVNLALMRSSRLFLFATLLEACPNTLIEAMTMGCLVASSNRPPMPEIAADSVLYFDPL
ncbi:MAG: hypothetical protein C3F19_04445, partial [Rhodocyclales bacterium]